MHQGADVPKVEPKTTMRAALMEITGKRLGCTLVVNGSGSLEGIFTDGDLRRLSQSREDFLDVPIGDVMHKSPHTIDATALASAALARMEERSITQLVVMESDRPVGIVHLHDLLHAGVV
jgi:arabinose-5-phosphate isomerase